MRVLQLGRAQELAQVREPQQGQAQELAQVPVSQWALAWLQAQQLEPRVLRARV